MIDEYLGLTTLIFTNAIAILILWLIIDTIRFNLSGRKCRRCRRRIR